MTTTARLSNIGRTTTKKALTDFLQSRGLPLAPGQPLALTSTRDHYQVATLTFLDNATLQRALVLPVAKRNLNGRRINIDDQFLGLTVLSEGADLDIVALHGLNGHAFNTWEHRDDENESFMWLRDSLPERIPGARVIIYGYRADAYSAVQTGRIRTFAETFLEDLRHVREDSASRNRPLILIGHSMGGLIIKQALLIANARTDKRFNSLLNSVGGVIFLGTPHQGGRELDSATAVANFLHPHNEPRRDLIKPLESNSFFLFDLTGDFLQVVEAKGIKISTFYETKRTVLERLPPMPPFLVVEEQSAILGIACETKAGINADHANLCRFKSSTDDSFITTAQTIKEWGRAYMPVVLNKLASYQPDPPDDLRYICLAPPDRLDEPKYPILQYDQYFYWALSYADKRYAMAILAYDKKGRLAGRWIRYGSRYICRILYDEEQRQVSFVGEGNTAVVLSLAELKISV